ncbi:ClpX C4-type zinc finger protein [Amycolatopsis endophytica]|uniref:ClpX-type ZB domain-containing protein n=2 Tax=Amycolatopsis endophytica TaxID=860233 RepID=A0A853AYQ4_9PSEU|nr:hypothetical protein [Amycolatopsis endophytica]
MKPNTEVSALVAGPGVFICDGCVELCRQVIDANPGTMPQLAPWEQIDDVEEVLSALPRVARTADQVEHNLLDWVRRARALGASWARVGDALGMARQSAWERFSGDR